MVFQNLFDARIGHSPVHADDALDNLIICHIAFAVYRHQTAERQPVHALIQGADTVRQLMRQHGNDPVYEINARSPLQCLPVQRGIFLYIIGYVRDMDAEMIQFSFFGQADRIIKVFGILSVYRHHLHIPQVHASCSVCIRNRIGNPLRLIHDLFTKSFRQVIAPDN